MTRKKRQSRSRQPPVIGFKAIPGQDDDITQWLEGQRSGARSDLLRAAVRAYMGQESLEDKLDKMEHHLLQKIDDLSRQIRAVQIAPPLAAPHSEVQQISDAEVDRRRENIGKRKW